MYCITLNEDPECLMSTLYVKDVEGIFFFIFRNAFFFGSLCKSSGLLPLIGQALHQEVCLPLCQWILHHHVAVTWAAVPLVPLCITAAAAAGIFIAVHVKTLTLPDRLEIFLIHGFSCPDR